MHKGTQSSSFGLGVYIAMLLVAIGVLAIILSAMAFAPRRDALAEFHAKYATPRPAPVTNAVVPEAVVEHFSWRTDSDGFAMADVRIRAKYGCDWLTVEVGFYTADDRLIHESGQAETNVAAGALVQFDNEAYLEGLTAKTARVTEVRCS